MLWPLLQTYNHNNDWICPNKRYAEFTHLHLTLANCKFHTPCRFSVLLRRVPGLIVLTDFDPRLSPLFLSMGYPCLTARVLSDTDYEYNSCIDPNKARACVLAYLHPASRHTSRYRRGQLSSNDSLIAMACSIGEQHVSWIMTPPSMHYIVGETVIITNSEVHLSRAMNKLFHESIRSLSSTCQICPLRAAISYQNDGPLPQHLSLQQQGWWTSPQIDSNTRIKISDSSDSDCLLIFNMETPLHKQWRQHKKGKAVLCINPLIEFPEPAVLRFLFN